MDKISQFLQTAAVLSRDQLVERYKQRNNYKEEQYKGYFFATYISDKNNFPAMFVFKSRKLVSPPIAYRTLERRNDVVEKFKKLADDEYQGKEEERLEKKEFKHSFQQGDILYSSYGYDQTNIAFYIVDKVLTPKSIEIQQIGTRVIEHGRGIGRDDLVMPDKTRKLKSPMKKTVQSGDRVKIDSYSSAWKWDGKPKEQTPSGLGH